MVVMSINESEKKTFDMSHLSVEQIHRQKMGKVSDKWSSYLPFYDELFEKYRTQNLNLLEISVQNGGSLVTWKIFFSTFTTQKL
jgi:hypothetical protein